MLSERPFYLDAGKGGVFSILHEPEQRGPLRPVLLLPPFGWEDMCSYRSRREWAQHLARNGRSVLRIDLPGSGDSYGSPRDAGLVREWLDAVAGAARWLAGECSVESVAVVGIGVGGLLACAASREGAPIDELILWLSLIHI